MSDENKGFGENNKKTILLLSDDLRMSSGIATMSKEIVFGTLDKYNWVQLGAAINHPDKGKEFDMNDDVRKLTGVADAELRLIPWAGYGDANILRQLMMKYRPDAILHFTDPRYWQWLYDMESEVRENIPILFYHIWDDLPDPDYNRNYYESCDWIGCISRQTYGITKRVGSIDSSTIKPLEDWQVDYVPHGINPKVFKPTNITDDFKKTILGGKDYKFILFWMNRNIKRKQPSDVIWAFKKFVDKLPENDRKDVCLIMHTNPIDNNGTDLVAVKKKICPDYDVLFSTSRIDQNELNNLYNMVDCTINIAGNEGFGLTTAESIMAGTPTIQTVTGGLQDQCGFKINRNPMEFDEETFLPIEGNENWEELTADDYIKIGSLHEYKKWEDKVTHGEWVKPVWPRVQTMVGSIPTPYIIDDKVDIDDVADAIGYWYNMPKMERMVAGNKGREWMMKKNGLNVETMCRTMSDGIDTTIEKFEPKSRYELYRIV